MTHAFYLREQTFIGGIPTELGKLTGVKSEFKLSSNKLCDDVPTQVQALSSGVTSGWAVTTGNQIGTMCEFADDTRFAFPTTTVTSFDYSSQGLTGTIPTQVRRWIHDSVCVCTHACVRSLLLSVVLIQLDHHSLC